jgi:hypothetical protein
MSPSREAGRCYVLTALSSIIFWALIWADSDMAAVEVDENSLRNMKDMNIETVFDMHKAKG